MANFFSGYLAQGTGTGNSFVENTTSGYARQAVTLATLTFGQTGLNAGVTFPGLAAAFTVTQRALYDAATGGNLIIWWALRNPLSISAGSTDTLASGAFSLSFPDLVTFFGSTALQWTTGTIVGSTSMSTPITAGVTIAYTDGTMEASSAAGLGGGSGLGFPGGIGLSSAAGSLVSIGTGLTLAGGVLSSAGTAYTFSTGLTNSSGTVTVNFGSTAGTAAQGNDSRLALASAALQPSALPATTQLYGGSNAAGQAVAITVGSNLTLSGTTLSATGGGASFPGGTGLSSATGTLVTIGSGLTLSGGTLASGGAAPSVSSTFTPSLYIAGSASGATYTTQSGRYWQNGALTVFTLDIEWSAMGSTNGTITITGLPAAASGGCGQLVVAGYGVTASGPVYGVVNTSGALTLLIGSGGTGSTDAAVSSGNLATAGGFIVTGSYFTA
jgi:hypothetical protein